MTNLASGRQPRTGMDVDRANMTLFSIYFPVGLMEFILQESMSSGGAEGCFGTGPVVSGKSR